MRFDFVDLKNIKFINFVNFALTALLLDCLAQCCRDEPNLLNIILPSFLTIGVFS